MGETLAVNEVSATVHDLAPQLERCFLFEAVEDSYEVTGISGAVPSWLRGTYYINGPARFQHGNLRYKHWLDGDGMVCSVQFRDESIRFTNRFVRTPKFCEEEAAGVPIYRAFGTGFPGDKLRRGLMLEPPVNVSVYKFAGTLLAFGEQSLPYELDAETLETRGEYDFAGKLSNVTPFSAHPKCDPVTRHLLNFGVSFSATQPMLNLYEFDAAGNLIRRRRHALRYQHSNHDFAISPHYAVFYLSPLLMNFGRFWSQNLSVMEALSWEPDKGSRLLVLPRESKAEPAFEIELAPRYCLHLINCFEDDGGYLIVDVLESEAPLYPEYQPVPDMFSTAPRCRPTRYKLHVPSRKLVECIGMEYDRAPDFPTPDRHLVGRKYDDFWMLGISATGLPGRKFFDQLAHGSWKRGAVSDLFQTERGQYLGGEPLYVSNPAAPDEAVIVNEFIDAQNGRAEILLFEASCVARGPIARLGLRHKIHPGFHTTFSTDKT